jgi:hypothetical protein
VTGPRDGDPLSAFTGWTRRTWEQLADRALAALRPYASPRHALIQLPGPASRSGRRSDGLEGFARSFLLAAFRLARSGDAGGTGLAEWYAAGLAAGTDPSSAERWPGFGECNQAKVEGASIAIALHETRPWIWDRLDEAVRERLVAWMGEIVGDPVWENNWTWFQAVMEAFLRSVGGPWESADIERTLDRTERWYAGDGWYSDGTYPAGGSQGLRSFDYYCGWVMNFHPLWYCRISGSDADDALVDRYRERLRAYLTDAQYLIAANGAPLYQGRSLVYRFAMLAPFWAGALYDATPLTPGATRRLASGVLKHFVDAGCFDGAGLLSLGWHRAFPRMRQAYSGPGSPYWAAGGFAGLVLPEDHPVWMAAEQPLPSERGDFQRSVKAPGWLVSGTAADGIVRIAAHGPDHAPLGRPGFDQPEYARHGYSTHTGPDAGQHVPVDSHVALITPDGRPSHRRPVQCLRVGRHTAVSRSQAHWFVSAPGMVDPDGRESCEAGPWVTTASIVHGPWEVRLARIDAAAPGTFDDGYPRIPGPWHLRIGGWPIAAGAPPIVRSGGSEGISACRDDGLRSTVRDLHGLPRGGIHRSDGANAFGRHAAAPWVMTDRPVEYGLVYAALIVLSGVEVPGDVRLEISGDRAAAYWPGGGYDTVILPPVSPRAAGTPGEPAGEDEPE